MNLLIVNAETDMGTENVVKLISTEEYERFENLLETIKEFTKNSNYRGIAYHKRSLIARRILNEDDASFMSEYIPYSGSIAEINNVKFVEAPSIIELYDSEFIPESLEDDDED